jgi:hypothetical protein
MKLIPLMLAMKKTCVRFCCYEKSEEKCHCNGEEFFKIHENLPEESTHITKDFKILKGFDCMDAFEALAQWKFTKVIFLNIFKVIFYDSTSKKYSKITSKKQMTLKFIFRKFTILLST